MSKIELIKAEIERLNNKYKYLSSIEAKYKTDCYADLLSFINALPEEKSSEDLEKEMNKLISLEWINQPDDEWEMCIARHFFELGLNARKEDEK